MSDFTIMDRDCPEWARAWGELAALPINAGDIECRDEETGEVWQYMGTNSRKHQFRHRMHPRTMRREYVDIADLR